MHACMCDDEDVIRYSRELKEDEMVKSLDPGRGCWIQISDLLSNLGQVTSSLQASVSFCILFL